MKLSELPQPVPGPAEILVRVKATTINDWDWSLVRGKPYVYRLFYGITKPKQTIFGVELSGIVEAAGSDISSFKPGDTVYGDISGHGWGSWAEYVCVKESDIRLMPYSMDFNEAASLPHAFGLAWQGLVDAGELQEGQSVLINGGGGGVGSLGLQIAKTFNVHVSGIDHLDKLDYMRELGFDEVIDYQRTDFTRDGKKYDLILDTSTRKWPATYLKALKPKGKYVTVGGSPHRILQLLALKPLVSSITNKCLHMVALKPNQGLDLLEKQFGESQLKTSIDGPYPFDQIPEQLQRFGDGRHLGKIVITI